MLNHAYHYQNESIGESQKVDERSEQGRSDQEFSSSLLNEWLAKADECEFLADLWKIVDAHFRNADFHLSDCARELGRSERTVQRRIKELLNVTPITLVNEYRLHAAIDNIRSGSSIKETAHAVGYSNTSYFIALFKRQFGISPKQLQLKWLQ